MMRTARLILGTVLAAAVLVLIGGLPARAADELFDRTVPLAAGGSFSLQNVNGSVSVSGWDREAVEVRAVKTSSDPVARFAVSDLSRVQVGVVTTPGGVAVTTTYPREEIGDVSVTYEVRVPRRVWLQQVTTVNGSVHVSGLQGTGELHSVNGDVVVEDSAGAFSANTTNGDILLELASLNGPAHAAGVGTQNPLRVQTVNGSIVLALPADAKATLAVQCRNGEFHSDFPVSMLGAYTPREFHGRLGGGGTPVRLSTVNGAIRIRALAQGI
jgi:hypothetical protein